MGVLCPWLACPGPAAPGVWFLAGCLVSALLNFHWSDLEFLDCVDCCR
jgi:hypothetical protein